MSEITLTVRQFPLHIDPAGPCREEELGDVEYTWRLPIANTALVLVDCWDLHQITSHLERATVTIEQRLVPTLAACRRAGITVIHAPSPQTARKYPQWTRYAGDETLFDQERPEPDWPPRAFRRRQGAYAQFAPPAQVFFPYTEHDKQARRIISCLEPLPDEYVVASGEQLHRLCRARRLLHLIYCGFAANICVLNRDYGIVAMAQERGYNVILLRDGTNAIENSDTLAEETMLLASVRRVETLYGSTTTCAALIQACEEVG